MLLLEAVKGSKIGLFLDSLSSEDKKFFLTNLNILYKKLNRDGTKELLFSDLNDDIFVEQNNSIFIPSKKAIIIEIGYKFWFDLRKEQTFRFVTDENKRTDRNLNETTSNVSQLDTYYTSQRDIVNNTSFAIIINKTIFRELQSKDIEKYKERNKLSIRETPEEYLKNNLVRYDFLLSRIEPTTDDEIVICFKKIMRRMITPFFYKNLFIREGLNINSMKKLFEIGNKISKIKRTIRQEVEYDALQKEYKKLIDEEKKDKLDWNNFKIELNDVLSYFKNNENIIKIKLDNEEYIDRKENILNTFEELKSFEKNSEELFIYMRNFIEDINLEDFGDCIFVFDSIMASINRFEPFFNTYSFDLDRIKTYLQRLLVDEDMSRGFRYIVNNEIEMDLELKIFYNNMKKIKNALKKDI